jgi:hypothetical protein
VAPLADVRPQVERDFVSDRRRRTLEETYTKLLARHQVVIQKRADGQPATKAGSAASPGAAK